eukprot:Filipodium_phascolosomae@DN5769_c0_g1_i1.p1
MIDRPHKGYKYVPKYVPEVTSRYFGAGARDTERYSELVSKAEQTEVTAHTKSEIDATLKQNYDRINAQNYLTRLNSLKNSIPLQPVTYYMNPLLFHKIALDNLRKKMAKIKRLGRVYPEYDGHSSKTEARGRETMEAYHELDEYM